MKKNDKTINLTAFLTKEVNVIFYIIVFVGFLGHIFDTIALYATRPGILIPNMIVCLLLVAILVLQLAKKITINTANIIVLW